MELKGQIGEIIYQNEINGYSICEFYIDGEELIDNTNLFEVKVIHDIEIRLPIKNIKKLFIN